MADIYEDIYSDIYGESGLAAFTPFTEDFYIGLPEVYRQYDAQTPQDYTLLKLIGAFGDLADELRVLVDRFWFETQEDGGPGFVQGPSGNADLANPARADDAWLRWLAQVLGVSLQGLVGTTQAETIIKWRDWLSNPTEAHRVGSRASLIRLGKTALSGTQYLEVLRRTAETGGIGEASEWDVAFVYRSSELVGDPAEAVMAAGAKPAGWLLHSREASATWEHVREEIGTWGAVRAKGTWRDVYLDGIG